MNKVEQQIECLACPWNKNCIEPPVMTKEEVEAKMEEIKPTKEEGEGKLLGGMMSILFFGGKDREAIVCPTFANVLRSSPDLSQRIKAIMREAKEE